MRCSVRRTKCAVRRTLTFNAPENIENYGEIATATATARKIRENYRATPRKMKITAKTGPKTGKGGSTSPKTRFLGYFYGFRGLQA